MICASHVDSRIPASVLLARHADRRNAEDEVGAPHEPHIPASPHPASIDNQIDAQGDTFKQPSRKVRHSPILGRGQLSPELLVGCGCVGGAGAVLMGGCQIKIEVKV